MSMRHIIARYAVQKPVRSGRVAIYPLTPPSDQSSIATGGRGFAPLPGCGAEGERTCPLTRPRRHLWAVGLRALFNYVTRKGEHGDKADPPLVSEADLGKRGNAWLAACHTRPGSHPPLAGSCSAGVVRHVYRSHGSPCERRSHRRGYSPRGRAGDRLPRSPARRAPHKGYALGRVRRADVSSIAPRLVSDSGKERSTHTYRCCGQQVSSAAVSIFTRFAYSLGLSGRPILRDIGPARWDVVGSRRIEALNMRVGMRLRSWLAARSKEHSVARGLRGVI